MYEHGLASEELFFFKGMMVKYLINEKEQKTFQHARIFFEKFDIQLDTSCSEPLSRDNV